MWAACLKDEGRRLLARRNAFQWWALCRVLYTMHMNARGWLTCCAWVKGHQLRSACHPHATASTHVHAMPVVASCLLRYSCGVQMVMRSLGQPTQLLLFPAEQHQLEAGSLSK